MANKPTSWRMPAFLRTQQKDGKEELSSVSILVYNNDLKSVVDNGLPKVNFFARRKLLRTWKRVNVEAAPAGGKDSVFYARDFLATDSLRAVPTEFIKINPNNHQDDVVKIGDSFEISFVGMSVTPQDTLPGNNNDLLLYSIGEGEGKSEVVRDAAEGSDTQPTLGGNGHAGSMRSSYHTFSPGFAPAPGECPFIHYDPAVDGHEVGNPPNSYVPIPATKSLFLRSDRHEHRARGSRRSVNLRFSVLDIDNASDVQIRAISSLGTIGQVVGQGAVVAPYVELLSSAFNAASYLGKRGLQNYAKPDYVMSKDVTFLLAPPSASSEAAAAFSDDGMCQTENLGNYLRYGYYFFLNQNVDARLYAQTGCSSQSMPLLLKRTDFHAKAARKNEKPFFPLTGISYVVVKVLRGSSTSRDFNRCALKQDHKHRLDSLLQLSNVMDMFSKMEKSSSSITSTAKSVTGGKKSK